MRDRTGTPTCRKYRDVIGFVNVLYGIKIPRRDGRPLGGTEFSNMHAAYDALPGDIKTRLANATVTHTFEKFWEHMRRDKNSGRPPMTEEQRRRRPPVVHPLFMTHPITGEKVLYCNPGYSIRINELPEAESDEMLAYFYEHQLEERFRYTHQWTENDLLVWDHIGTIHRAIADYRPDEIRLMRRCQVMATKVFDPEFSRLARRHDGGPMIRVEPTGAVLGATIDGVDLSKPVGEDDFAIILHALGHHGVLRFPGQHLGPGDVSRFSSLFGEIQGNPIGPLDTTREFPEVGILSNLKQNGQYIGSPDAGQDWHTDALTYRDVAGFRERALWRAHPDARREGSGGHRILQYAHGVRSVAG